MQQKSAATALLCTDLSRPSLTCDLLQCPTLTLLQLDGKETVYRSKRLSTLSANCHLSTSEPRCGAQRATAIKSS